MAGGGNLGKASLVLTTKDAGLNKGLGKAEGGIKGWASGIKGKVAGALAGIGAAIAGFAAGSKFADRFKSLGDAGKQAAALGVASDVFMGLSQAAKEAGVEGEQFGTLLQKAQVRVAEGSEETVSALGRIGLTLGDLRGKSPDEIFYKIADGMNGVSDQGTRAFVATKLFEEEGAKLLPVMARGSAGLKEFVSQQKAMGTALSQTDMDGILSAQAKVANLSRRVEGLMNRMTASAAPFLEIGLDIAETVIGWLPPFNDVKYVALAVFQGIAIAGAYTWDALKVGAGGLSAALGVVLVGWGAIFDKMADVVQLGAKLPGGQGFAAAAAMLKGMGKGSLDAGKGTIRWGIQQVDDFGKSATAVNKFFDGLVNGKGPEKFGKKAGEAFAATAAVKFDENPALERGTKEEYSARVRWEAMAQSREQQLADAAKKTAANTANTNETLKKLPVAIASAIPALVLRTV